MRNSYWRHLLCLVDLPFSCVIKYYSTRERGHSLYPFISEWNFKYLFSLVLWVIMNYTHQTQRFPFLKKLYLFNAEKLSKRKLSGFSRPFQPFSYYGDKMKEDETGGHVVHVGEITNVQKGFGEETCRK
jgi:hypothetical protein